MNSGSPPFSMHALTIMNSGAKPFTRMHARFVVAAQRDEIRSHVAEKVRLRVHAAGCPSRGERLARKLERS